MKLQYSGHNWFVNEKSYIHQFSDLWNDMITRSMSSVTAVFCISHHHYRWFLRPLCPSSFFPFVLVSFYLSLHYLSVQFTITNVCFPSDCLREYMSDGSLMEVDCWLTEINDRKDFPQSQLFPLPTFPRRQETCVRLLSNNILEALKV